MLKRVFIYYIIFCLLIMIVAFLPSKNLVFEKIVNCYNNVKYTFYTCKSSSYENCECINVGYGSIINCNSVVAKKVKKEIENLTGESCVLTCDNKAEIYNILNLYQAVIVNEEVLNNIHIVYAYSSMLSDYVIDMNNKINLQIAFSDNTLTIGYPLILGSY